MRGIRIEKKESGRRKSGKRKVRKEDGGEGRVGGREEWDEEE